MHSRHKRLSTWQVLRGVRAGREAKGDLQCAPHSLVGCVLTHAGEKCGHKRRFAVGQGSALRRV